MGCFSYDKPKPIISAPPIPQEEYDIGRRKKRKGKPFGEAQRDLGELKLSKAGKLGIISEPEQRLFG